jgi:two-component sensor histidine kinase
MALQKLETRSASSPLQPLHLLEEISHRVANEYAEAIATLRLAAADAANAQVGAVLSRVAERLHAHADVHRALLAPAAGGSVDLADYVSRVCASMSRASLAANGVQLLVDADEIWLESGRSWRVGLIVAELVRNAARHGLCCGPGAIRVSITEDCGSVTCRVGDNGRLARDAEPGRGRRLVEALAAELGGSVDWWFTPAGCLARLEIPTTIAKDGAHRSRSALANPSQHSS